MYFSLSVIRQHNEYEMVTQMWLIKTTLLTNPHLRALSYLLLCAAYVLIL